MGYSYRKVDNRKINNLKLHSCYFIIKSGQTEITQWAIPLWEVKKVILHSEIFDLRIGKSVIAE